MRDERGENREQGKDQMSVKPGTEVGIYSPLQLQLLQATAIVLRQKNIGDFTVSNHPDQSDWNASKNQPRAKSTPLPGDQVRIVIQDNEENPAREGMEFFRAVYRAAEVVTSEQLTEGRQASFENVIERLVSPFVANPGLLNEFKRFLRMPTFLFMKDFIREIFKAALPNDKEAYHRYENSYGWQREKGKRVPPQLPLRALPVISILFSEGFRADYPKQKYNFVAELAPFLARSDDPRSYAAMVNHVITPFPLNQRQAFDGPSEMELKSRWIRELVGSVTNYGTLESNPLARKALIVIYKGISPGGKFYEAEQSEGDQRRIRDLREMRIMLLEEFSKLPDVEIFGNLKEFLREESFSPDARILLMRVIKNNSESVPTFWYQEVIRQGVKLNTLTPDAGSLLEKYLAKNKENSLSIYNNALESMINRELQLWRVHAQAVAQPRREQIEENTGNLRVVGALIKEYSAYPPNFGQAEAYILGLIEDPATPKTTATTAAWQLQKPMEWSEKITTSDKKRVVMRLIRSFLTTNPEEYPARIASREGYQILGAVSDMLYHDGKIFDEMTEDEASFIVQAVNAYGEFRRKYPAGGYDSEGRAIERIMEQSQDRFVKIRIQTEPDMFARWITIEFADFNRYYHSVDLGAGNNPSALERQAGIVFDSVQRQLVELVKLPDSPEKRTRMLGVLLQLKQQLGIHDLGYNTTIWQKGITLFEQALRWMPEVLKQQVKHTPGYSGLLRNNEE